MKNLILADVIRILKKRRYWSWLILIALLMAIMALWAGVSNWSSFAYVAWENRFFGAVGNLLVSVGIFMDVYGDEFRSKSMQAAIGRGISRKGIIVAKIIDCIILAVIDYLILGIFEVLLGLLLEARLNAEEMHCLVSSLGTGTFLAICLTAMVAVIVYATENIPIAVFLDIILFYAVPLLLQAAGYNKLLAPLHLHRFFVVGIANNAFSDMMLSGSGAGSLVIGSVVYIGLAYLLSYLVFRKKELEF